MTQPDELIPLGALSATGLAALAAKTQEDWEDELYGGVESKINPLSELFGLVTEAFLGVVNKLVEVFSDFVDLDSAISTLDDILQFFYSIGDRSGFFTVLDAVITFFTDAGEAFYDTLMEVINFFTDLTGLSNASNLDTFLEVFGQVVDFFASIASGVRGTFLSTLKTVVDSLGSLTGLSNVANLDALLSAMKSVSNFVAGVANFSTWSTVLKTLIDGLLSVTNLSTWTAVLKQTTDFFAGISDAARPFWLDILDEIVTFFASLTSFSGWTTALKTLIDGLLGITSFSTWVGVFRQVVDFFLSISAGVRANFLVVFKQVVDSFVGLGDSTVIGTFLGVFTQVINFFTGIASGLRGNFLTVYKQVIDAFVGLGNSTVIGTFLGVLTQVINFFGTITSGARGAFLTAIQTVVEFFQDIIARFGDLDGWLGEIPLIGPLYWFLSGKTPDDDGAPDLSSIGAWARGLLDRTSQIPAGNLIGVISKAVLGVIPVSSIGVFNPNLLEQFGFEDATVVDAADGWTWDETTNRFGSPAGAAKLTLAGTSGVRQLYYNQDIEVVAGDKLQVSGYIKTSGYNGNSTSIVVSLVPYIGTTAQTPIVIGARGASTSWVQIVGSASSSPVTLPWTVPTAELAANQITGVRVRLAVNADATAGSVWWDDISLTKQGLLGQSLVDRLFDAWRNLFNGLFGTALDPTSRTVDDVLTAADAARLSIAGLQSDVTQFLARNANNNLAGRSAVIDFSSYANATSLGDGFTQVYTGSGGGTLGVSAGQASWLGETLLESRNGWARYRSATGAPITAATTATDYQKIGLAFSSIPNTVLFSNGFNYIIGRSNAWTNFAGASFVYLKLGLTVCELRYVINGVDALLQATPAGFRFRAGATYWLECGRSDMDAPRIYRALENGTQIFSKTDGSNLTQVGENFRFTGFGASNTNPFGYPGRVSAFAYYDNTPAPTRGSGFRRYRGATNLTLTGGTEAKLPSGFFTESDIITDDITYTTATLDPNRVTVSVDGWYAVELRLELQTFIPASNRVGTVIYLNNGIYSRGTESIGTASGSQRNASGTHLMYLRAGDYLQPGFHASDNFSFTGNAQGTSSYFSVTFLGNKKPEA